MPSSDNMLSVTRRVFECPKCDKCVWRPGSARTRWGSFSASPDSLAAIGGGDLILRGRGAEGTEKGRGKERGRNRERRVRGGDCLLFILFLATVLQEM